MQRCEASKYNGKLKQKVTKYWLSYFDEEVLIGAMILTFT